MSSISRRSFLKSSGAVATAVGSSVRSVSAGQRAAVPRTRQVSFVGDGTIFDPPEYAALLADLTRTEALAVDRYSEGGVVEQLERRFASLTGKDRAIFLPSGTMANQLAIRVLSGSASKVFVQDASHLFRDEADAAQIVHGKRLIPLAPGRAAFTMEELQQAIRDAREGEVFQTGLGAISIECPVRRADGAIVPIEEIRRIADLARSNRIPMHLDGARLFLASAYSGVGIREYASHFDTVYISLYKYLGAGAGAILCGSESVIEAIPGLEKILGGVMFRNWPNAAVALHVLDGFEERFARARAQAETLFTALNQTGSFHITHAPDGSNIYRWTVGGVDPDRFRQHLLDRWNVRIAALTPGSPSPLMVNETLLSASASELIEAFHDAHRAAPSDARR